MSDAYRAAGVDLELGDRLSRMFYEASRQTWPSRDGLFGELEIGEDAFRGMRVWNAAPLFEVPDGQNLVFALDTDGIGTKAEISERTSTYAGAGFDVLAMALDDPAAKGLEPCAFVDVLEVNKISEKNLPQMMQIVQSVAEAAVHANVVLVGGETAEVGNRLNGYGNPNDVAQFSLSAAAFVVGHRSRLIDGREIGQGEALVAFREYGFRSNGLSLVRNVLETKYGPFWHQKKLGESTLGELARTQSIIYTPVLVELIGGYDLRRQGKAEIHGVAHITGGGIPSKLGDLLTRAGIGADIYEPYEPPELMRNVQFIADLPDEEAHHVFNMGQGMIVATSQPDKVIQVAGLRGVSAKQIGVTTKKRGIRLRSAGRTPGLKIKYATN